MTPRTDIKTHVNRGLAWLGMASSMVWLLDVLAFAIVMKLWIDPDQYGLALPAISLFVVLDLASEMGLSAAIVQRDDHTEARIHTMFWLNLGASLLLAALLAGGVGPLLSLIHGNSLVGWLITAYGIKLVWQSVYAVPQALMRRDLQFKELSIIRVLSNVGEFSSKVGSAALGFGVWCFVIGPIVRYFIVGIGVQVWHPWRPRLIFRFRESLAWVRFGLKQTASQLVYQLYSNADYQIVGYFFGSQVNGLYGAAYELVLKPCHHIGHSVQGVAFPTYARLKNTRDQLIAQFLSLTRLTMVAMLAFLAAIVVSPREMLVLFTGPEYAPAALAAQVFCFAGLLRAMSLPIQPLLDGVGRPGLNLTYSLIAGVTLPALFSISAALFGGKLGYMSVVWSWVVGYPIAFAALLYMALRTIDLSLAMYLRRVGPIILIALAAVAVGVATRWGTAALSSGMRLVIVLFALLTVFLFLLAYWQGISPRTIRRSLAGPARPPAIDPDDTSGRDPV